MTLSITDFMDIDSAASFLKIKRSTLYAWVHQRRIPHRKHGRRLVFARQDLENWSLSQAVRPMEDAAELALGRFSLRAKESADSTETSSSEFLAELFDKVEDRQNQQKPVAMNRS
jgi:excisionase family DNA binding protein